jgi:DNA sulfur modification protein DndC
MAPPRGALPGLHPRPRRAAPPNNNTLRWCTSQIKIEPMAAALQELAVEKGFGRWVERETRGRVRRVYEGHGQEKILVITGVRVGESAARDRRIALSCSKNGSECGQGWYQSSLPTAVSATLAPILHWRVCHVWDWLRIFAPGEEYGGWSTAIIAEAYGGEEAEEINARTGCVGCPLAHRDTALDALVARAAWSYLEPLTELRAIYRELREPRARLRKPGGETRADGTLVENQHRMGPIKLEVRTEMLERILAIQERINAEAQRAALPLVDILNASEVARIRQLIEARTWPQRWTGAEPGAEEPFIEDGQAQLFEGSHQVTSGRASPGPVVDIGDRDS